MKNESWRRRNRTKILGRYFPYVNYSKHLAVKIVIQLMGCDLLHLHDSMSNLWETISESTRK